MHKTSYTTQIIGRKIMDTSKKMIKRGDVVWLNLPVSTSSHVQEGTRPAIIVQNDIGNIHSPTTIIVPITSVIKKLYMPTHVRFSVPFLPYPSMALCEHCITIDVDAITSVAGHLPDFIMRDIDRGLYISILS